MPKFSRNARKRSEYSRRGIVYRTVEIEYYVFVAFGQSIHFIYRIFSKNLSLLGSEGLNEIPKV